MTVIAAILLAIGKEPVLLAFLALFVLLCGAWAMIELLDIWP